MINIDDRVTYTDGFAKPANDGSQQKLYDIYTNLGIGSAAFFANAIDTRTKGVDFVATHKTTFDGGLKLANNLAFTYSKTEQDGAIKTTPLLEASGQADKFFSNESRIFLELAVPRVKWNLSHNLSKDKWSIFLRNAFFGSVVDGGVLPDGSNTEIGAVLVTDLTASYSVSDVLTLTVGANNLFDVYPDELDVSLRSSNQFTYSRRVSQFGNNGRFLFARLSFELK